MLMKSTAGLSVRYPTTKIKNTTKELNIDLVYYKNIWLLNNFHRPLGLGSQIFCCFYRTVCTLAHTHIRTEIGVLESSIFMFHNQKILVCLPELNNNEQTNL